MADGARLPARPLAHMLASVIFEDDEPTGVPPRTLHPNARKMRQHVMTLLRELDAPRTGRVGYLTRDTNGGGPVQLAARAHGNYICVSMERATNIFEFLIPARLTHHNGEDIIPRMLREHDLDTAILFSVASTISKLADAEM